VALFALLALASSQCTLDGNTYSNGIRSITFGAAVGDIFPALLDYGAPDALAFGYWSLATDSRWAITDVGSVSGQFCSNSTGQYDASFLDDCTTLQLNKISDDCNSRSNLLENTFALVDRSATADCTATGTQLTTTFGSSSTIPALSGEVATIVLGSSGFALVSVSTRGILYQRWTLSSSSDGTTTSIVDLGSYGDGLSCPSSRVGTYLSDWDADCGVQLCGISDSCVSRGELFHGALFNGFQTNNQCPRPTNNPGLSGFGQCNPTATEWNAHPYDCIDQLIEGGCMFCLGRANGREARQCLDRNGAGCNDVFNSPAGKNFCTLEFECPATTATISITMFISALLALLLIR